jgi:hypothetical protein
MSRRWREGKRGVTSRVCRVTLAAYESPSLKYHGLLPNEIGPSQIHPKACRGPCAATMGGKVVSEHSASTRLLPLPFLPVDPKP